MSDQLNFKQVPFDTMYYNNPTKHAGQVLIDCDPNRTVLKIIESCITKNNTVLSDAELAQWIFRYYTCRTNNHIERVKLCATYFKECFEFGGYYERFIAKVQNHDYDKFRGNEHVASYALNCPRYTYPDLYDISPEAKRIYEEIEWPKHYQLNDHHPEHYMRCVDEENNAWAISDDEMEEFFKDKGGHPAALMALGEMVADWMAVGIEMGDTAKDWWLKNKDKRWSYGPRYTQALEACLEWIPSKLYVQSSEPIPDPPKLKMNVMSEVSEEVISQIAADNIKDGLVYHASPVKVDVLSGKHTGKWSGEQGNVFVTPVKGLAACFVINKNDVVDKAEQQLGGRLIGLNFGYDVWNKPVDKLRTLPREIVVTLNVRGLKPFTGESTGYLYTIDYTKYADKTHMFHKNPNSDVEFLIEGDVRYKSCEKITIKWKCVSSEDDIKRHGEAKVDSETSLEEYDEQKLRDSVYSEETAHLVIRKEYVEDVTPIPQPPDLKNKDSVMYCPGTPESTQSESLNPSVYCDKNSSNDVGVEKLFINDEQLLHAVKSTMLVNSIDKLYEMLKPGDLLMIYRKDGILPRVGQVFNVISTKMQGSSFSSIKIIGQNKAELYGYGSVIGYTGFKKTYTKQFLSTIAGCLVLRNPALKKDQLDKIFRYLDERVDRIPYDVAGIIRSVITHIFGTKDRELTQEELNQLQPLFCSSIFAYAFKAAGVDPELKFKDYSTVWPKDFAIHSAWKPVYSYFIRSEQAGDVLNQQEMSAASYTPIQEYIGEPSMEGWFDQVKEEGTHYTIHNFPVIQFFNKLRKEYKTSKLEHLFEVIGIRLFFANRRTIVIHKFFVPELLYLLSKYEFPSSLINTIRNSTWVGAATPVTNSVDLAYINKMIDVKLYEHQTEFLKNYMTNKVTNHLRGYLLSFEQGLGKTITSLCLMEGLKKEHVVIICPKNTMMETWNAHLIKFFKDTQKVWVAGYTKGPLTTSSKWIIVNYERIDEIKEFLIKNQMNNLGIIVDESHNFLRTSSQRTQLLIDLANYNRNADILLMSGTPIKSCGVEMIPLLRVLDPYFDDEAVTIFKRTFGFNTSIANDVLNARLDRMMTRVRKDILDLPEKKETTINVRMSTGWKYTASQVEKEIVDFVKKRQDYYNQNLQSYLDAFEEVIEWLRDEPTVGGQPDFQRYLSIIDWLRESNISDARGNADIVWANQYEKDVLIPALPEDLRKQFIWSKSVVKYLPLKIKGEVIGQLLTRLRMQMTTEMLQAADIKQYVDKAMKKTVVFTSYVDTIEVAYNYFQSNGYNVAAVYGKTASELTATVKRFQEDQSVNPLIASLKMLSTGATLTAANTVIFLNKPWRSIEYQQASDRVHRIGQDTECEIISLVLDTGKEANLSTRMEDIMQWSGDQFDQIVDQKEREMVKKFFMSFASLEIPEDCVMSLEKYDPPYNEEQMREHGYAEEVIERLKRDPAHSWRMKTGIELIHIELTRTELKRIWKNWQQMTPDQKRISDRKCRELFGCDNKTLYEYLIPQYKVEMPDKGVVKYPPKSDESSLEAISADTKDEDRGPISESDKKKIGKYIYHGTHRDLDIKNLGIHVCKNRANTGIKAPVVYMNRTLGVASLHVVPFMVGHGSKLKNYEEHFVNLEEAIRSESPVKHVEIVHNDPDLEECSGEQTGYIYWVEAKEFLDDLYYATPEKPNDWNFVSYRQLPIAKKTEVKVTWHKKYDPDFAKKVKGGFMAVESLSVEAQQSSTPSKIAQKKKKILDFICKLCDTMEPSGLNSKRYRQIIGQMNDKEFDQFMNYMKEGKWQLHIVAPNMIVNLQNEDLLKACDLIGLKLFHKVWMYDKVTGRKYLTDNEYMFVKLPVRRQQQFLDEKISVPDNDRSIDGLTGQVTGDSRSCAITNPEIHILAARGLDKTLQELVNVRGGNVHGYNEFRRMLEETGEADLDALDPNSKTRVSVVGKVLLQSMMIDTNL